MWALVIQIEIILLLAWAITYLKFKFHSKKNSSTSEVQLIKLNIDQITDIFYKFFGYYLLFFMLMHIPTYTSNSIFFQITSTLFGIVFLYFQMYVIHKWKILIKLAITN